MDLKYLTKKEFEKTKTLPEHIRLPLIAKMCRLNTLVEVKKAGSGHLGSSLSAMDIVVFLYYKYMNIVDKGFDDPDRDIYFSSKGHDVPGLYAVLYSLGVLSDEKFLSLRRLNGLDGHPDIRVKGIESNTGSLGMGISKGKGMALAKTLQKRQGKIFVLTGDGEFQEGQNFEALQSASQQKINNLVVIMDHNKLQSDRAVSKIVDLGDLDQKIKAFGWHVAHCDGHDFSALEKTFLEIEKVEEKPIFIICDTIKGRGISFMEHPYALDEGKGYYKWHSGAPNDEYYFQAHAELSKSIASDFQANGLGIVEYKTYVTEKKESFKTEKEFVSMGFGQALLKLASRNKDFVVLDADLSADCKIFDFESTYPHRFVECGIAEQDMVSMAGGMALQGVTPIVNSFASFLASRPNEQIYNNVTENTKIIYACHYAGLIPAGPGKSHQSIRDIALFSVLPNCIILQAANAEEMGQIVEYALDQTNESCMFRIPIGPSPQKINLPGNYKLSFGKGVALTEGKEYILFGYGPIMLNEALTASRVLQEKGVALKVISMPWLNRFDKFWLQHELKGCKNIFFLEDHAPFGGLGDNMVGFFMKENMDINFKLKVFGVEGIAECGTPEEVLRFHRLDGESIAQRILREVNRQ